MKYIDIDEIYRLFKLIEYGSNNRIVSERNL